MPSPSIVVFDLGKVLVDFDYGIAARRIGAGGTWSFDEVQRYLSSSTVLVRYETGRISRREFFDEVRRMTGFTGSFEEFGNFFADIFTEIPAMTALLAALRGRGLPVYLFSNTNDLAVTHIRNRFSFFDGFDGYILSYEVHSMKPDVKIYEALERLARRRGPEVLYLDDRPENVEAGERRGWQVILHETPERTREAIGKLGLL